MSNYLKIFIRLVFTLGVISALCISTLPFWADFNMLIMPKYILLFVPRWWLVAYLCVIFILWKYLSKTQRYVLPLLFIVAFDYLDFQLPKLFETNDTNSSSLKIVSVNLGEGSKVSALRQLIFYYQPDIVLMQEVSEKDLKGITGEYLYKDCVYGLCIISKQPMSRVGTLNRKMLNSWGDFAAFYQVEMNGSIIDLVNVHLETPRSVLLDILKGRELSYQSIVKDENRRLEASLLNSTIQKKNSVIMAGDFNMPDDDPIYISHFSWLKNAFNEYGFGLNHTQYIYWQGIPFLSFRIDHILFSKDLKMNHVQVLESLGGDHRPIMASLIVKN